MYWPLANINLSVVKISASMVNMNFDIIMQVKDSYAHSTLVELIICQDSLNKSSRETVEARKRVELLKSTEEIWLDKIKKRELLKLRISLLQTQLLEKGNEGNIGEDFGPYCFLPFFSWLTYYTVTDILYIINDVFFVLLGSERLNKLKAELDERGIIVLIC